jgi:hypothetical protein
LREVFVVDDGVLVARDLTVTVEVAVVAIAGMLAPRSTINTPFGELSILCGQITAAGFVDCTVFNFACVNPRSANSEPSGGGSRGPGVGVTFS